MNWTATYIKCPERHFTFWNISLEILCLAGVFINFVLFRRFFGDLKKSVFLLNLASCDMGLCVFYFWTHFLASCAMLLQSDILAEIQVFLCFQRNTLNYFDYLFENILIFYIVVERFLWTCTSKTRKSWKIFAVGKYKMRLTVITILFFIGATMIYIWKLEVSRWNRLCETRIYSSQYERPFLRFLVNVFFPLILYASLLLTLIFALLTLCRLTRIGRGEGPVTEEDRELAVVLGLTNSKIKRSILCMLMVYLTFVIRFAVHYTFLPASLREMYLKETVQQRNSRKWKIDMLNVVFFMSRMIIYKVFCGKDQMVVDFDKFCQGVELYSWSDKDKVEFAIAQKIPLSKDFVIKIMNNIEIDIDIVVAKLVRKDSGPKPASKADEAKATPIAAATVSKDHSTPSAAKAKKGPTQADSAEKSQTQASPKNKTQSPKKETKTTKIVTIKETKYTSEEE